MKNEKGTVLEPFSNDLHMFSDAVFKHNTAGAATAALVLLAGLFDLHWRNAYSMHQAEDEIGHIK